MKFSFISSVAPELGMLLSASLPEKIIQLQPLVVPLPIHKQRLRERGFNQAEEIAKTCAETTGLPYAELITKTKHSAALSSLTDEERATTPLSFALTEKPAPEQPILLIDDVITTGTTASTAAHLLRKYTNAPILVGAIARGR